jgi:hypothetical protein
MVLLKEFTCVEMLAFSKSSRYFNSNSTTILGIFCQHKRDCPPVVHTHGAVEPQLQSGISSISIKKIIPSATRPVSDSRHGIKQTSTTANIRPWVSKRGDNTPGITIEVKA